MVTVDWDNMTDGYLKQWFRTIRQIAEIVFLSGQFTKVSRTINESPPVDLKNRPVNHNKSTGQLKTIDRSFLIMNSFLPS